MERVGFIGLGVMGNPMVRHLIHAGYPVAIYDRDASRTRAVADAGGIPQADPRAVAADCEILVLMVLDQSDVDAALFGERGAAQGLRPGSLVIVMSTIPATAMQGISERLAHHEVALIDAPVSGGRDGAAAGTLAIMVGGEPTDVQRALPLLSHFGENVTHVGPLGSGQVAKAANQVIVALTRAAVGEALLLAGVGGADPEIVRRALLGGAAQSTILENYGARISAAEHPVEFSSAVISKDLKQVVDTARTLGLSLPFTELVAQCYRDAEA